MEILARALIVGGVLVAIVTVAVIIGQNVIGGPTPPPTEESLGPLLEVSTLVYDEERGDIGNEEHSARSVVLTVPEAATEDLARTGLLRLLRQTGWRVSSGGGAVPPEGEVCLVVTTPSTWLDDAQNTRLRERFDEKVDEAGIPSVIVDLFYCRSPSAEERL